MDYLKLGSPEKAIPFLQRALKLDPSNREAHQALASCYLGQENFRSAAEEFARSLCLIPTSPRPGSNSDTNTWIWLPFGLSGSASVSRVGLGTSFSGRSLISARPVGRCSEGVPKGARRRAAAVRPAHITGQAYVHAQKSEDAETEFHLELKLDSQNELAWLGLANLQLAKGQAAAALESLAKVWEVSPEFLAVQRSFASIELTPASAKDSIAHLLGEPEGPARHFLLATLYAATNESALSDREWKSFQSDFLAWQQAPNAAAGAHANQEPCKAHRYSRCADSLQMRKRLTDSERLLLERCILLCSNSNAPLTL